MFHKFTHFTISLHLSLVKKKKKNCSVAKIADRWICLVPLLCLDSRSLATSKSCFRTMERTCSLTRTESPHFHYKQKWSKILHVAPVDSWPHGRAHEGPGNTYFALGLPAPGPPQRTHHFPTDSRQGFLGGQVSLANLQIPNYCLTEAHHTNLAGGATHPIPGVRSCLLQSAAGLRPNLWTESR